VRAFLLAVFLLPATAAGNPLELVRDIMPPDGRPGSLELDLMLPAGELLFFLGNDLNSGIELWRTDGSEAGTFLVADFCPGPCDGFPTIPRRTAGDFVVLDDAIYFSTDDGLWKANGKPGSGIELVLTLAEKARSLTAVGENLLFFHTSQNPLLTTLWVSDGTPAGSHPIRDFSITDDEIQAIGGKAFFFQGRNLWISDATREGTFPIFAFESTVDSFFPIGDRLILVLDDEQELWSSDGTTLGTFQLRRFERPASVVAVTGEHVYAAYRNDDDEALLWASDGSGPGGEELGTLRRCSNRLPHQEPVVLPPGELLFVNCLDGEEDVDLWRSDGTPEGTFRLTSYHPPETHGRDDPPALIAGHGQAFFVGQQDGVYELWRTDGTVAGTRRIADLGASSLKPRLLGFAGDRLIFCFTGAGASRLFSSDGSAAGTVALVEAAKRAPGGPAAEIGDTLIFPFYDETHGVELWRSDGTAAGTRLVADVARGHDDAFPQDMIAAGEKLFFEVPMGAVAGQLWRSDGTTTGTVPVDSVPSISRIIAAYRDSVFIQSSETGADLWITDGSESGTARLASLPRHSPPRATLLGERMIFLAGGEPLELWRSDGTVIGTLRVASIPSNHASGRLTEGPVTAGDLAFFIFDQNGEVGLWRTDGTLSGTFRLDLPSAPHGLTAFDERIFFTVSPGSLWSSDGSAGGTAKVVDPDEISVNRIALTAASSAGLYVLASEAFITDRFTVLLSDGSPAGTRRLGEVPREPVGLRDLHPAGDGLFLVTSNRQHGREIWHAGPTGVRLLRDICPGPCSSFPQQLKVVGEQLFFAASDGPSGLEPWLSDGSEAGTRRIADLAPGAGSSKPRDFALLGERIFFQGDDQISGAELWAYDLTADCPAGPELACLRGGRFEVTARWRNDRNGSEGAGMTRPLSDDTTLFSFFDPSNVELGLKVLDGRRANQSFWVFFGALSDVEYWIDVRDRVRGTRRGFHNPPRNFCGQRDLEAFPDLSVAAARQPGGDPPPATGGGSCTPGGEALCLHQGRFRVEVEWRNRRRNDAGRGKAIPISQQSGMFYFFRPQNLELIVKVLDGRRANGHFWVFYGALTDLEYQITVTDLTTGQQAIFTNPQGQLCGGRDTLAF